MLERFVTWLVAVIGQLGYPGILTLMAIESSVIPIPAELVMPPAGYLAAVGRMNVWIALACGTLGGLLGSGINYWIASRVGRWFFVRYGRWMLISEHHLARTERFFERHGPIAVFVARLIPVARHLISIPAGIARMPLGRFFLYTGVGAGLYSAILLTVGWLIGTEGHALTRERVYDYTHHVFVVLLPALVVLITVYVFWHRRRVRRAAKPAGAVRSKVETL